MFKKKDPKEIEVQGKKLFCGHCNNTFFYHKRVLLNTSLMSLFSMDWLNRSASTFTCSHCYKMHWFNT